MLSCYMCDQAATSNEHAPPKCLFPNDKNGPDYRKNLITVPSCAVHNTETSKDDVYLLYVLAASITSNDLGLNHFLTKVKKTAIRKPALAVSLLEKSTPIVIEQAEYTQVGAAISINGARLNATLKKIAYAIYYHENKMKFTGSISLISCFTLYKNISKNSISQEALKIANHLFENHEKKGCNPDVFCYRYESNLLTDTMLLDFYGSTQVIVHFNK